jgi:hypothetical protein
VLLFLDLGRRWTSREAGKRREKYNAETQSARRIAEKKAGIGINTEDTEVGAQRAQSWRKAGIGAQSRGKCYEGNLY